MARVNRLTTLPRKAEFIEIAVESVNLFSRRHKSFNSNIQTLSKPLAKLQTVQLSMAKSWLKTIQAVQIFACSQASAVKHPASTTSSSTF